MSIPKTVVIGCAGVGSRLGLGQTKALIDIHGKPIIQRQLEMLQHVEDVRIVVGFQASEVIKTVLAVRKNVTFVFNHDYFHSKTSASVYLASQNANEHIFTLDGDVIIHPEDMEECLQAVEPFVGVTSVSSEEAVLVETDFDKAIGFSREAGDYEWIGPALLPRDSIHFSPNLHLYEVIEPSLPLKCKVVRSMDIDTMQDYNLALQRFKEWGL
ncbi:NTP transferase domain-containing protein [Halodesulfovibrio sp.]|uniref:NTP transferase domain-containing protein n=1 Tax=Halodesulfovibrio sp. TaxID=1912772 RepID=UPI0025C2435D|nr:NTP transferase domain-containing protein [Halodesulfovibrio sp.]